MKRLITVIFFFVALFVWCFFTGVNIKKELLYDRYTLTDSYPYKDTTRYFQWHRIDSLLNRLDSFQHQFITFGIIANYKNKNGVPELVEPFVKGKYNNYQDTFGIERYQSIPLYTFNETDSIPRIIRYGRDGSLIGIQGDTLDYYRLSLASLKGEWFVPKKYVEVLGPIFFHKAIFVDRTNQNIATLELVDSVWLVRSMNPATTGLNRPPYQKPTPKGIFVIQEQKNKMVFLRDGTQIEGGFSPYASRFCCGGYIHGVPVNYPSRSIIEYSQTLGTNPRSHMCVRNATSHALFIYNWAAVKGTLVFVFD